MLISNAYAQAAGASDPTGGLMANWILVNVNGMASHSGEAVAVRAVDAGRIATECSDKSLIPQALHAARVAAVKALDKDPA